MSNNFTTFDLSRLNTAVNRNLYGNIVRASGELVVGAGRYKAANSTRNTIKVYQSWKPLPLTMNTAGSGSVDPSQNNSSYLRFGNSVILKLNFFFTPDALDDGPIQSFAGLPSPPSQTNNNVFGNVVMALKYGSSDTQQAQVLINDTLNAVNPLTDIVLTQGSGSISYDAPDTYIIQGQITYRID